MVPTVSKTQVTTCSGAIMSTAVTDSHEQSPAPLGNNQYELSSTFTIDNLYLLVENTIFHVNRRNFVKDSEFFQELFELPQEKGKPTEGSSAQYPLHIEGVDKEQVALLLRVMFPEYICQDDDITAEQWVSVLDLLTMWRFKISREAVLKKLSKILDPCRKIVLYHKHSLNVEEWLLSPAKFLAQRTSSITEQEAEVLGLFDAVKLGAVRERFWCSVCSRCYNPWKCIYRSKWDPEKCIREVYGLK